MASARCPRIARRELPATVILGLGVAALALLAGCRPDSNASLSAPENASPASIKGRPATATGTATPAGGLLEGLDLPSRDSRESPESQSHLRFTDIREELGIDFVFNNGFSPRRLMTESTSGGCAWLDYDADGWPDLFFAQGGDPAADAWNGQPRDELYRNLAGEQFVPVTQLASLSDSQFGHGVAVADFDNDGFDDIYVCNVGPDVLHRNQGDGTFQEVTVAAGISNPLWSASAAWGDLNGDGNLDIYVCNYVDYDPKHPIACLDEQGNPATCHPENVDDIPNVCYFSRGDGTFDEVSNKRGLNGPGSKSLGVVIADFNGDHLPDVYVANDTKANHLFVNQGDGHFREDALALGCALSGLAHPQASMGVAYGDYDRNGWPDLYVTHFTTDSNTLYQNLGPAGFTDATRETGLHVPTLPYLAFGTVMADFDHNGWQDLFVANGHIDDWRNRTGAAWYMPAQLFRFDGQRWRDSGQDAGPYFLRELLGRAVATADFDRDGDLDLAVVHQNDPVSVLRNDSDLGHFLQLEFIGTHSNRSAIGVQVTVRQDERELVQQLPGGTSYCASHQRILSFGLGDADAPCNVSVRWPSGWRQELENVSVDRSLTLLEDRAED